VRDSFVPAAAGPLVVTDDPELLEELLRLCAVAGCEPSVLSDAAVDRGRWLSAPVVLLGGDRAQASAAAVSRGGLSRRASVVLVTADRDGVDVWRQAVEIGVERVAVLPDGADWLVDRLADALEGEGRSGTVIAVAGGRGGAGASVLAAGLAVAALRRGWRTLLVDADPLGGGLDLAVGAEEVGGLRWPDLGGTSGRISAPALISALPALDRLTVLACGRETHCEVSASAMRAVLRAGRRGNDLVVVDLPRTLDAPSQVALTQSVTALLVVPAEIRACAAAATMARQLQPHCADLRLVVRGPGPARLRPDAVQEALGLPLAAYLRSESAVALALERGEPPGRQPGALARVAARLLDDATSGEQADPR
jgi:secretion/DNA translocation related CpaE-like protein